MLAATYQLLYKLHHVATVSYRAHLHQSVRTGSEMKTMFLTLKLLNPISASRLAAVTVGDLSDRTGLLAFFCFRPGTQ